MKKLYLFVSLILLFNCNNIDSEFYEISKNELKDKIKGAWAAQTIGVTFGGPTEFRYLKRIIPDSIKIEWTDSTLVNMMKNAPGLYDDIYMDLTFVDVLEKEGFDAPASSHLKAYSESKYWLWHANQQGRYNYLNGIDAPESGHWINNPHADDIDFQIEADFAGIMNPGMPNSALEICDKVGHIMNYGDGYYGGVFVAAMYSNAFIENDIKKIINNSLNLIPERSTFHQCISDVINWHKKYPNNWKKNWSLIEEKWGNDIGCPDGAFRDFNIDAKINSAYVVLGLLYGEDDFDKTLDISTRAGQDSDCNPATAMGILATVKGFSNIPNFWLKGLEEVEDINFQFTEMSLNDVYKISYKHAEEMIIRNGGKALNNSFKIKKQKNIVAPYEENFPGYELSENIKIDKKIKFKDNQEIDIKFNGIGIVLRGESRNLDKEIDSKYAMIEKKETLNNFSYKVEFRIDGELIKTMNLPIYFIERAHELFFKYELEEGDHTLNIKILNPNKNAYLRLDNLIVYRRKI